MKIDWKKVWKEFELWREFATFPDKWSQYCAIQSLVEQQLRQKVKRRKK